MKPLNAREYLTAYYRDEDKTSGRWKSYEQLIALMDDFALISEGALGQAWPKEHREQRLRTSYDDELDAARARRAKAKVKAALAIGEVNSEPCNEGLEVPSLASLILGPSIKQALETGDAAGAVPILQHAENIPKMMEAIHSVEGPFPEVSVPVLATTIEFTPGGVVDLSGVQLTGDQLLRARGGRKRYAQVPILETHSLSKLQPFCLGDPRALQALRLLRVISRIIINPY